MNQTYPNYLFPLSVCFKLKILICSILPKTQNKLIWGWDSTYLQSTSKVCSINFKPSAEFPWMNAVPAQLRLFLLKIRSSWHDRTHNACPKLPRGWKTIMVTLEQFAICRWSTSNRGKQLWDVWDHVASINIKAVFHWKKKQLISLTQLHCTN